MKIILSGAWIDMASGFLRYQRGGVASIPDPLGESA
ncbi:hypothetical protein QE368_002235 [Asaia bogorensis NBRC 16594]|nr:hypothetical protein P792_10100 [Asaia sp. SF2.1]MDR6183393.1 hypothetical protein [Asaia bogorensis NBRC 16594]